MLFFGPDGARGGQRSIDGPPRDGIAGRGLLCPADLYFLLQPAAMHMGVGVGVHQTGFAQILSVVHDLQPSPLGAKLRAIVHGDPLSDRVEGHLNSAPSTVTVESLCTLRVAWCWKTASKSIVGSMGIMRWAFSSHASKGVLPPRPR